jgi:hypothetical protein
MWLGTVAHACTLICLGDRIGGLWLVVSLGKILMRTYLKEQPGCGSVLYEYTGRKIAIPGWSGQKV